MDWGIGAFLVECGLKLIMKVKRKKLSMVKR